MNVYKIFILCSVIALNVSAIEKDVQFTTGEYDTWAAVLDVHEQSINNFPLIARQRSESVIGAIPCITSDAFTTIPIRENNNSLVDLRKHSTARLAMMTTPDYPVQGPEFNSGLPRNSLIHGVYTLARDWWKKR